MKHVHTPCPIFVFAVLLILLAAIPASAQTAPNSDFRLMTISFTGLRHFKQPQIIALSGLFPGESVSLQTLSDAANRLAQYGVFQKVPY